MAKSALKNIRPVRQEPASQRVNELARENEELRRRLEDAEATLQAIRSGEVDAVIVSGPMGEQVFTLKGEDHAYRALVEAMNEGAATISTEGLITYCNSRFPLLFGVTSDNIVGQDLQAILPAAHVASVEALFDRAVEGEPCEGEFRFETEDESLRVIHVSLSKVAGDDPPSVCMVVTDLSQRQSELMLRLAQKAARCGSWEWNPVTNESVWAPELWEIFGLQPGSCRPSYKSFINCVHPEDRQEVEETMRRQLGEGHLDFQFRAQWPDGSVHWILVLGTVAAPTSVVGLSMDITERRQTQQALIRSEKLASVGRMAATIAHEINNPLSAVMNTLYLLQNSAGLKPAEREYLKIADSELKRIAHITQQSLGFYRERSEPTTFPVSALLESVVDVLRSKLNGKDIKVVRECDLNLRLTGIFGELRQVFANLVANGIDAAADHGTLRLQATPVASGNSHAAIEISVSDEGSGIEPATLAHIFEPFFTTKKSIGTGLGLWISKQIVEKHGGSIRVSSNTSGQQRGTTFSVLIPTALQRSKEDAA